LDYHDLTRVTRHQNYQAFIDAISPKRIFAITTKGTVAYTDIEFCEDDVLLFGSETEGLPAPVMESIAPAMRLRIPMLPNNRSLNLSNSVAIVAYEAWRQLDFSAGS